MTRETFGRGMAALCENFSREQTSSLIELYWGALSHLADESWNRAMTRILQNETFFPTIAKVLSYAMPAVDAPQASEIFDAIEMSYSLGRHLDAEEIRRYYGSAARYAFVAVGGRNEFEWVGGEGQEERRMFALKRFNEAWDEVVAQDRQLALPPGEDDEQERLREWASSQLTGLASAMDLSQSKSAVGDDRYNRRMNELRKQAKRIADEKAEQ